MADGHIEILIGARADRSLEAVFGNTEKRAARARANIDKALNSSGADSFKGYESAANKAANASVSAQTRAVLAVARMRDSAERKVEAQRLASERRVLSEQVKNANAATALARQREAAEQRAGDAAIRAANATAAAERRAARERQTAIDRQVRSQTALDRQRRQEQARTRRDDRAAETAFARRGAYHSVIRYSPGALHRGSRVAHDLLRGAGVDFSLSESVRRNVDFQSGITRLQNQASFSGQDVSREALSTTVKGAADTYGLSRADTSGALDSFVTKTGDTQLGMQILQRVTARAAATGGDASAYMAAAGEAAGQLGDVKDKAGALLNVLDQWIVQGAKGSVEMKDLSSQAARLAAPAGRFEGDVTQRMGELGALAQLAKKSGGASTASEATNAVARFADQLRTPQRVKQFKALGIETFSDTEKGQLRNPFAVIEESLVKTQGDPMALKKLFASSIGDKPVMALATTFNKAGGGEAGIGAVRAQLAGFMDTKNIEGKIKAANERRDADPAVRAQKFMATLDDVTAKMMSSVLPSLERAGPSAIKVAEWLGKAAAWSAENPLKAVGVALAASVARAGIESGIRAAMEANVRMWFDSLRSAGGGPAVGGGGGPGGASGLGKFLLQAQSVVVAGAAVYVAGQQAGELKQQTGAESWLGLIPGFSGKGEFQGFGRLGQDLAPLVGAGHVGDVYKRKADENMDATAREQARARGWNPAEPPKALTAVVAPQGPMPVVIDQAVMTSAMTAALRSGEIAVRVTNHPPPAGGSSDAPPVHGDAGRGRAL